MRKKRMLVRKRRRKMMEKVKMMMKMMRLRGVRERERQRMMMMRTTLKLRSRRQMCRSARKLLIPPFLILSTGEEKRGHQVESSIRVHTPNCRFCRNNQDFKALPSYEIL